MGGFMKSDQSDHPDILHTFYSLAALALTD